VERVTSPSLLSDDLLRSLVAVGQVDILVGVPTLNNAPTIAHLVRAVQSAFTTYFSRQRAVFINSDGGSDDGTPSIVRDCSLDDAGTVTAAHQLRTIHRISTPYHGLPGKGSALRLIFAAADLLQADAVAVLDPEVTSVTPDWVAALLRPVREDRFDFVAPMYPRDALDSPLVTQLLRPLVRSSYGHQIREPLIGEFGCSGRFAASCIEKPVWESDPMQHGVDLWLMAAALSGTFRPCQAALGPRVLAGGRPRPRLSELFEQVVGSAFHCLELFADSWLASKGAAPLPTLGSFLGRPPEQSVHDGAQMAESFSRDVRDLDSVLQQIVLPETLAGVRAVAEAEPSQLRYPDDLWVATVHDFLLGYHAAVIQRNHIVQALVPLYLGRAASFLNQHAGGPPEAAEEALESLCVQFETSKAALVERWNRAH
jgi:hypothetical protein